MFSEQDVGSKTRRNNFRGNSARPVYPLHRLSIPQSRVLFTAAPRELLAAGDESYLPGDLPGETNPLDFLPCRVSGLTGQIFYFFIRAHSCFFVCFVGKTLNASLHLPAPH